MFYYFTGTIRYPVSTKEGNIEYLNFSFKKATSNKCFNGITLKQEIEIYIKIGIEKPYLSWVDSQKNFRYANMLKDILNKFNLDAIGLELSNEDLGLLLEK